jgi:hypothetical protein
MGEQTLSDVLSDSFVPLVYLNAFGDTLIPSNGSFSAVNLSAAINGTTKASMQ